jgi:hypothetical protein
MKARKERKRMDHEDPKANPLPDPEPDPAEDHEEETARPNALVPAILFLLAQAKIQNRDLTNTVNDHLRNLGEQAGNNTPAPVSHHNPSRRFRGRG